MKLKEKIANITDDVACCGIIARHLKEVNPSRLSNMLVWGTKGKGFYCQAMEGKEVYGHEFKIDMDDESLIPVII